MSPATALRRLVPLPVLAVAGMVAPVAHAAVDTKPPALSLATPAAGAKLTTARPTYSGNAGHDVGDSQTVTVRVYTGTSASGTALQTLNVPRNNDKWSVVGTTDLTSGTYTAQARQSDAAGNVGVSQAHTFTVTVSSPAPPPATCSASSPSAYAGKILGTPGLVGYWRLGEASGTSACDAAGSDVGTYQAGTTLGRPGALLNDTDTAVGFNGTSGWVSIPDSSALHVADRFTIEAWVRRGAVGTASANVVASKQHGDYELMFNQANALVLRRSNYADLVASTATVTDTTQWHHVVATKDGAGVHLYLDGADVTGTVSNQTMVDNTLPLAIGQSSTDSYFNGDIDEVGLYSVALSPAQVADHYAARGTASPPPPTSDPVIAAAGDIACDPGDANFNGGAGTADFCRQADTANLLAANGPDGVLTLGDNQYFDATASKYSQVYAPTWGRFKSITHPDAGNHDYVTSGAAGYFDYFDGAGAQTGPAGDRSKGYYSYDIGTWHLIALNSNCDAIGGCGAGSAEDTWLKSDLAAHPATCTLAYWHHPRFSSGWSGSPTTMSAEYSDLYSANADLLLVGHEHDYERFAPQDPNAQADPSRGIREIVVGTGGEDHDVFYTPYAANSEVRNNTSFGVLRLTLHPSSYDWQFVPVAGQTFTDSGSTACH